jgi:hypothetical protein
MAPGPNTWGRLVVRPRKIRPPQGDHSTDSTTLQVSSALLVSCSYKVLPFASTRQYNWPRFGYLTNVPVTLAPGSTRYE